MKSILLLVSLLWSGVALAQTATQSLVIRLNVLTNSQSRQQTPHALLAYNQIQSQASAAYTAGQSITLQPGFEAQAGSVFAAMIEAISSSIGEFPSGLQARILGNPVVGNSAEVEITGVASQTVHLRLVDLQGRAIHEQRIEQAGETEQISLPLGTHRGPLLLKVNTDSQQQSLKVLRP